MPLIWKSPSGATCRWRRWTGGYVRRRRQWGWPSSAAGIETTAGRIRVRSATRNRQPRSGAMCALRRPRPRQRNSGGRSSGPGHRTQVLRFDVVQPCLARATRHHRRFARIGLEDVHHRAVAVDTPARRHAGSQGASQTRPQMELKGLVEVIASNVVIGPNGAGKSTLPALIGGIVRPVGAANRPGSVWRAPSGRRGSARSRSVK